MTKNEFLTRLTMNLKKNGVTDTADIISEYEEHFAFKLADGYSEEEISATLGDPSELASQFENNSGGEKYTGRKLTTVIGLIFTNLFAFMCFVLLWAWEVIMAAASIAFGTLAVCLIFGLNIYSLIPPTPYLCGAIFGLSCIALAILTGLGCIYFAAYLRQLMRACARFNHNAMAAASGKPVLPPVPTYPMQSAKARHLTRRLALASLTAFAVCFVLGMIVSILSAGAFAFWHVWGWFGYTG